jgi:hypothetical protein
MDQARHILVAPVEGQRSRPLAHKSDQYRVLYSKWIGARPEQQVALSAARKGGRGNGAVPLNLQDPQEPPDAPSLLSRLRSCLWDDPADYQSGRLPTCIQEVFALQASFASILNDLCESYQELENANDAKQHFIRYV